MLADIEKETVDFVPTYDESQMEPVYLPAQIPNLLVNGSAGIAVGMATNIPPHNLNEVINAIIHYINKPEAELAELAALIPGPDFPTGGFIYGKSGIAQAYATGRGSIVMRARAAIEKQARGDKEMIVVTEIPYQMNKAKLIERIAELVQEKKIEGISDLRDESDREGNAYRRRIATRRAAGGHLKQSLQADPDADQFRRDHAGNREWAAKSSEAGRDSPVTLLNIESTLFGDELNTN